MFDSISTAEALRGTLTTPGTTGTSTVPDSLFSSGTPDERGGSVQRFAITGADPEHARQTYQDAYSGERFTVAPGTDDFAFRYASVGDDRVTLRTSTLSGHLRGDVPHLRDYMVLWFRSGSGEVQRGDTSRAGTASEPFLFPSEQRFSLDFAPHRQNIVQFAPAFLEDIATEFHAGRPQAVSFDHDARPDAARLSAWRQAVTSATTVLVDVAATSLLRVNAQRVLARALLRLFPWFGLDVPKILREPSLARTRVALEFMQHHAHRAITPADAARAAGLHTRTLQQATQLHLGVTPSGYLRTVRLERARRDLVAASPDTQTVAAIARAWGFGNLGRFSAAYQKAFAEKACDTLRR